MINHWNDMTRIIQRHIPRVFVGVRVIARVRGWDTWNNFPPFHPSVSGLAEAVWAPVKGFFCGITIVINATRTYHNTIFRYRTIIIIIVLMICHIHHESMIMTSLWPRINHYWTPVKPSYLEAGTAVFGYAKSWISVSSTSRAWKNMTGPRNFATRKSQ